MSRVAVVTGGSRGIGAATARLLSARGWSVVIGYASDAAAAEEVVADCQADGVQARAVRCDVTVEADVVALFGGIERVDALVNNAGVADTGSRVVDMTRARVERVFAVNVVGLVHCTIEALRLMQHGAAIVNVSSGAARLGSPGEFVDYAATKGAVDTFTLGLAREVAAEGIRVNAVRPGLIDTGFHVSAGNPERFETIRPTIPMQRAGTPEEVAAAIVWLCSPEASYVTGAILDVTGGR